MRPALAILALLSGVALAQGSAFGEEAPSSALRIEVYTVANQVDSFLSTPGQREKVLEQLDELGVTKIYLEVDRGGYRPKIETLRAARDFFREKGLEVAAGVATHFGPGPGVQSNRSRFSINFEAPATQAWLRDTFELCASEFDEIMIDDFVMTDDESELSIQAKGDRSWSEYRLDLMGRIARECFIAPAKAKNPKVTLTFKFPQWYDRFHEFGYDVVNAPKLFEKIWVGTETRDPETLRFGFTQPTEGFINYTWLASAGQGKTQGAWFDTIECNPDIYLMQAYQSVLAGAKHITLFNLSDVAVENPTLDKFKKRREAVIQLAALVGDRRPTGLVAYKPPNSPPGRDTYLFDFLAVLGLPIEMTAQPPEQPPAIILTAHSAADSEIEGRVLKWVEGGTVVLATPGFFEAAKSAKINALLGCPPDFPFPLSKIKVSMVMAAGLAQDVSPEITFLNPWNHPGKVWHSSGGEDKGMKVPLLAASEKEGGRLVFFNVSSFGEDAFSIRERLLTPERLDVLDWPWKLSYAVQTLLPLPIGAVGKPPFGFYYYAPDTVVLANFRNEANEITVYPKGSSLIEVEAASGFTPAEEVVPGPSSCIGHGVTVKVPAWEVVALKVRF
jgi:hypothetical protein